MFSRPERFALKPTPRASSELILPRTSIRPLVGVRIPARVRTRVDLPAPLAPMMPSDVPSATSNDTFLRACTSCTARPPRPICDSASFRVGRRSKVVRYVTETFCALTAGLAPGTGGGGGVPIGRTAGGVAVAGAGGWFGLRGGQRTHAPGR